MDTTQKFGVLINVNVLRFRTVSAQLTSSLLYRDLCKYTFVSDAVVIFKTICIRIGNKPERDMNCVCISLLKVSLVSVENGCLTKNETICYC